MKKEAYIEPVPAATVILVREYAGGLQVWLLRRGTQSGFMGGYYDLMNSTFYEFIMI